MRARVRAHCCLAGDNVVVVGGARGGLASESRVHQMNCVDNAALVAGARHIIIKHT